MENTEAIWQQRLVKRREGMPWKTIIEAEGITYNGTVTYQIKKARERGWIPPEETLPRPIRRDGKRQGLLGHKQEAAMPEDVVADTTLTNEVSANSRHGPVTELRSVGEENGIPSTVDRVPSDTDDHTSTVDHEPFPVDDRPSTVYGIPSADEATPTVDRPLSTVHDESSMPNSTPSTVDRGPSTVDLFMHDVQASVAAAIQPLVARLEALETAIVIPDHPQVHRIPSTVDREPWELQQLKHSERWTIYVPRAMKEEIKQRAAERQQNPSLLVQELLWKALNDR